MKLEPKVGLHFQAVDDGQWMLIEMSSNGQKIIGGKHNKEQVDAIIEALKIERSKME